MDDSLADKLVDDELSSNEIDESFKADVSQPITTPAPSTLSPTEQQVIQQHDTEALTNIRKDIDALQHERTQGSEKEVLQRFEQALKEGKQILLATDFDKTISQDGLSKGEDPRDSQVNPQIQASLQALQKAGVDIAVISARSARKIAEIVTIPGLAIVGTLGWETFHADEQNPTKGVSEIHESFTPYREQLTSVLGEVRKRFLSEDLGVDTKAEDEIELEYKTPSGQTIVLERKGVNDQYSEGIYHSYNFNQVSVAERVALVSQLRQHYQEVYRNLAERYPPDNPENETFLQSFQQMSGIVPKDNTPEMEGRYSFDIGPLSQQTKSHAIIEFMRQPDDPKRDAYFSHLPGGYETIFYAGDDNVQDGKAFHAGRLAQRLTQGRRDSVGVWVNQGDVYQPKEVSEYQVMGVAGNAALLGKMTEIATNLQR